MELFEIQQCLSEAILYIDFITMLFIGVLSFNITPISTFREAIVSKCLPEHRKFVVVIRFKMVLRFPRQYGSDMGLRNSGNGVNGVTMCSFPPRLIC